MGLLSLCDHCVLVDPTPHLAKALSLPFLGLSSVCLDALDAKGKQVLRWGDEEAGVVSS